ncbi:MAG TPA: MbcA/ParS/Xre antitoxin family protein [Thermoanaerobaculia bacterium]|nr:MbcA/ParS/Xre antitoxin family protein [Thermoanaerobaculia bacterium]
MSTSAPATGYPHVLLTAPGEKPTLPRWLGKSFDTEVAGSRQIGRRRSLPELTVVRSTGPEALLRGGFLDRLASRLLRTPAPAKVLFVFEGRSRSAEPELLKQVLLRFRDRSDDVEFARVSEATFALHEAIAKIWAGGAESQPTAPDPGAPLARLTRELAATADLRAPSGRLSAERIAAVFGLSIAELGALIGRSRQSLSKTKDSASIQRDLQPFERIAQLRAVLSSSDFRAWLNRPNEHLDGQAPLDLVRGGHAAAVADLVDDMISGSPT